MNTMIISQADNVEDFVDEQVSSRGYGNHSEYARELIRRDQDRQRLRSMLLDGAASAPVVRVDDTYIDGLRTRVHATSNARR